MLICRTRRWVLDPLLCMLSTSLFREHSILLHCCAAGDADLPHKALAA
jgi:hypothetical protein